MKVNKSWLPCSGISVTFVVMLVLFFVPEMNTTVVSAQGCNASAVAETIARNNGPVAAADAVRNSCLQNNSPYWSWKAVEQSDVCRELDQRSSLRGILNLYYNSGIITFSPESAVTNGDMQAFLNAVSYAFDNGPRTPCIYPGIAIEGNNGTDGGGNNNGGGGSNGGSTDGGTTSSPVSPVTQISQSCRSWLAGMQSSMSSQVAPRRVGTNPDEQYNEAVRRHNLTVSLIDGIVGGNQCGSYFTDTGVRMLVLASGSKVDACKIYWLYDRNWSALFVFNADGFGRSWHDMCSSFTVGEARLNLYLSG